MSLRKHPPFFDNDLITISSTVSSPKSGLANPSIDLALDYEGAILLYMDNVYLDVGFVDVHDGESLLPLRGASHILGGLEAHEVSHFYPV